MREKREQLKYVVPGYVWAQPRFRIDWEVARPIIDAGKGTVVVESQSQERREYAAASFLALMLSFDYHADVGWTSFYPRPADEFTGAYRLPKHKAIQAIALKTKLTPEEEEQVQDLAASCEISVIAAEPGFRLYLPHVRMSLTARKDSKNHQKVASSSVI